MQVIDRLTTVAAAIDDHPVTAVKLELPCQITNYKKHVGNEVGVVVAQRGDGGDGLLWNYQEMYRGLRSDIMKCEATIVFVDDFCRNFFVDNPLEDRLFGHG